MGRNALFQFIPSQRFAATLHKRGHTRVETERDLDALQRAWAAWRQAAPVLAWC